jgi:uncharacterized membrane protein YozB (DUF420 family)
MPQIAAVVSAPPGRRPRVDRWFYISVAVLMILFNVAAFAPSIVNPSSRRVPLPLTPLVAVHAIVAAGWLLLFLAQATLVATGRTDVHRRLGVAGSVLAAAFVVVGCLTTIDEARRGFDLSGDLRRLAPPDVQPDAGALLAPINFLLMFGVLVAVAICCRRRPAIHKRLMLFAMLGALTPTPLVHVIGHWPALLAWRGAVALVATLVFLSASAIHDRVAEGRIHPVSLWAPLFLFAWAAVVNVVIVPSVAWREFAEWLVR